MAPSSGSTPQAQGALVGSWVGARILASRVRDGSTDFVDYNQPPGIGIYQSVPPVQTAGTNVQYTKPFMLQSASQFHVDPPPALNSAQYTADYSEVHSLGSVDSSTRTPDQTKIALFWVEDDAYTWNAIARAVMTQKQTSLEQDAKTFA